MTWAQPRSLQARQLLAASLGLVAFLALAGYALDRAFLKTAEQNMRERLRSYALSYADDIDFLRNGEIYYEPATLPDPRFERPGSGLYAMVALPNGQWHSPSAEGPKLPPTGMLGAGRERFERGLRTREIDGRASEAYRYGLGLIWSVDGARLGEFPYTIYILENADTLRNQVAVFRAALWRNLGGAGLILLLLQTVVLRWSLRPLRRVIDELKRVQRGGASRMSEQHPRELAPLTDSINAFIESERANLEQQRNTLADLAHSLKTPLAVLRSRLDANAAHDELRDDVATQTQRMNELVSYQLARAASGGHTLFAAPIGIEPIAEEIVRGLEKVYAARGVLCEFDVAENAQFHGTPGDLHELLGNLLENAFKWARSRVLLTIAIGESAPNRRPGLLLAVDDDGPGIPADKVALILQRGVRGDERVHGHGIGLAIVQDIVRAYRATLEVKASEELGGARFEVRLPPGL